MPRSPIAVDEIPVYIPKIMFRPFPFILGIFTCSASEMSCATGPASQPAGADHSTFTRQSYVRTRRQGRSQFAHPHARALQIHECSVVDCRVAAVTVAPAATVEARGWTASQFTGVRGVAGERAGRVLPGVWESGELLQVGIARASGILGIPRPAPCLL